MLWVGGLVLLCGGILRLLRRSLHGGLLRLSLLPYSVVGGVVGLVLILGLWVAGE